MRDCEGQACKLCRQVTRSPNAEFYENQKVFATELDFRQLIFVKNGIWGSNLQHVKNAATDKKEPT